MSALAQRGTMALEDSAGLDFPALRTARRDRVFDAMDQHGIDVLMLNRAGNARYVVGHRPIWRSVVTPWAPMCTVVRATRQIHLMAATWDDGIPADISHENLSQLMWNPRKIFESISKIPGLADAECIGVDGMSPSMPAALEMFAPKSRLVNGERILRQVRAVKLPAEIECIQMAISMTEGALAALRDDIRPGVSERGLQGRFHEELCRFGINHPAQEGTFCATPRDDSLPAEGPPPIRLLPDGRPLGTGDLVAVAASVPYAAYEGVVARTWPCVGPSGSPSDAQRSLYARWRAGVDAVVDRCRPGNSIGELQRAWIETGEPLPAVPVAYSVGLGVEFPVVGGAGALAPPDERLHAGMVLGVQGYVWERAVGGYLGAETILVTNDGPRRLTRLSHDPLAARSPGS
jgi:Xaa-Pro dipeptidase